MVVGKEGVNRRRCGNWEVEWGGGQGEEEIVPELVVVKVDGGNGRLVRFTITVIVIVDRLETRLLHSRLALSQVSTHAIGCEFQAIIKLKP